MSDKDLPDILTLGRKMKEQKGKGEREQGSVNTTLITNSSPQSWTYSEHEDINSGGQSPHDLITSFFNLPTLHWGLYFQCCGALSNYSRGNPRGLVTLIHMGSREFSTVGEVISPKGTPPSVGSMT